MAAVIGRFFNAGISRVGGNQGEVYYDDEKKGCLASPFISYYIITFSLNTVSIAAGILSQFEYHRRGQGYYFRNWIDAWYFANAVFGVLHILAALYIVKKIRYQPQNRKESQGTPYHHHHHHDQEAQAPTAPPEHEPWWLVEARMNDANEKAGKQPWYARKNKEQPIVQAVVIQQEVPSHNEPSATYPDSWPRIKSILLEDKVFALYIMVFVIYVSWHFFANSGQSYYYNPGVRFVEKCSDIFILAGPASFIFSVFTLFLKGHDDM